MKRRIAIIGASYLQLPLVLKAREMGLGTLCFAWEEGAVCKDSCDAFFPVSITEKERIAEICREQGVCGVATISSDVAVPTVFHVAHCLGPNGNSERSAFLNTTNQQSPIRKRLCRGGSPDYFGSNGMAVAPGSGHPSGCCFHGLLFPIFGLDKSFSDGLKTSNSM